MAYLTKTGATSDTSRIGPGFWQAQCQRRTPALSPQCTQQGGFSDAKQGPPRRAGVVPLPRARSAQREGGRRKAPQGDEPSYAALSQYPALNGLLMRNARGDTSTSLSVGIFSSGSAAISIRWTLGASLASFARSAWLLDAERATEKNRNTGREFSGHSSSPPRRGRCPAAARALPCRTWRS